MLKISEVIENIYDDSQEGDYVYPTLEEILLMADDSVPEERRQAMHDTHIRKLTNKQYQKQMRPMNP